MLLFSFVWLIEKIRFVLLLFFCVFSICFTFYCIIHNNIIIDAVSILSFLIVLAEMGYSLLLFLSMSRHFNLLKTILLLLYFISFYLSSFSVVHELAYTSVCFLCMCFVMWVCVCVCLSGGCFLSLCLLALYLCMCVFVCGTYGEFCDWMLHFSY